MLLRTVTRQNFAEAWPDIICSVAESQVEVGKRLGIDSEVMYTQPYCHNVAPDAARRIKALGWAAVTDTRRIPGIIYHEYLRFPGSGSGDDEIIADGTWGQFVPTAHISGYEPRVLAGTRGHVRQSALQYGISPSHAVLQCWLPVSEETAAERLSDYFDPHDIAQLRAILDM